ncbi:hypothetical protein [Glycomyces arizonensis]|uniref:hypothetical protein n=1 Tax=Glycomyces arizonensis TaxID=256035 RepID=UPI00047E6873|nr:hypothetical protein [Glycomyces arizonensis]
MSDYAGFGVDPQDVWDAGKVDMMRIAEFWSDALEYSNSTCRLPPYFRSAEGDATTSDTLFNDLAMDLNTDSRAVTERVIAAAEDLATSAEKYLEDDEQAVRDLQTEHEETPYTSDDPVATPEVADEVNPVDYQEAQRLENELDLAN